MKNKAVILFLIFLFLAAFLAFMASTSKVAYDLAFLWSRNFQLLIKVVFASALCLLIFRWITNKALPRNIIKLVYGAIFLPLIILPVFRCCFKVPYVFCRICPNKCPWGISRTFIFSAFLTLNLSGRFWCFYLCPFGTFQECQAQISKQNLKLPFQTGFVAYPALLLTAWMYSLTLLGSQMAVYFTAGYYEWMGTTVFVAAMILIAAFFIPRFWCRLFCPVGIIAELFSGLRRRLHIFCSILIFSALLLTAPQTAQADSHKEDAVFLGDSLTAYADWQKYYPGYQIIDKGVPADDTQKALARLNAILHSYNPGKVFIMLGINDIERSCVVRLSPKIDLLLQHTVIRAPVYAVVNYINEIYWIFFKMPETIKNYKNILGAIRSEWPQAEIFVQSVLPINDAIFYSRRHFIISSYSVNALNQHLKKLSHDMSILYLDLYPYLVKDSQLKKEFSYDGVHLNSDGNTAWRSAVGSKLSIEQNYGR